MLPFYICAQLHEGNISNACKILCFPAEQMQDYSFPHKFQFQQEHEQFLSAFFLGPQPVADIT